MSILENKINKPGWRDIVEWFFLLAAVTAIVIAVTFRLEAIGGGVARIYTQTGLATFILLPLTVALIAAIINAWVTVDWHGSLVDKTFHLVAVLGPMAGFLGTTLGLMQAISALGEARTLDGLLTMVGQTFEGMGVAFSTTVWGLLLAIVAVFIVHARPEKPGQPEAKEIQTEQGQEPAEYTLPKSQQPNSPISIAVEGIVNQETDHDSQTDRETHQSWTHANPIISECFEIQPATLAEQKALFGDPIFPADAVQSAFEAFGISELRVHPQSRPSGVRVTKYEAVMPEGLTVARLQTREVRDSVAMKLGAATVNIEPHEKPGLVRILVEAHSAPERQCSFNEALKRSDIRQELRRDGFRALIGQDTFGEPVSVDLAEENLLIGGTSGSGKSNAIHQLVLGLASCHTASQLRFAFIDPHAVELMGYAGLPHTQHIAWKIDQILALLKSELEEVSERYHTLERAGCRSFLDYNIEQNKKHGAVMPLKLIVIDEVAAIPMDGIGPLIEQIAQQGRKAGVRLVLGTQAPRTDFLSGPTKANVSARLCLKTTSLLETRQVMDCGAGSHELTQPGEAYLLSRDTQGRPTRVNTFEVSADLIKKVQSFWRSIGDSTHSQQVRRT